MTTLSPALGLKVYFTQVWCPLPQRPTHYSHRASDRTLVNSIQCCITWKKGKSIMVDMQSAVRKFIAISQEASVCVIQQLYYLIIQFHLCLCQLIISTSIYIVDLLSTYRPCMHISHHYNPARDFPQPTHSLHPIQQASTSELTQQRRVLCISIFNRHYMRRPM